MLSDNALSPVSKSKVFLCQLHTVFLQTKLTNRPCCRLSTCHKYILLFFICAVYASSCNQQYRTERLSTALGVNTLKRGVSMIKWIKCWLICALDSSPPRSPGGGNRPPKEGRMHQNNLFHCIHTENIIDLLLGSRNNRYKLVYGGFGEVFVIPQRTAVVFKFICENRSIKNGFSSWPTTEGGKKESFSKPKKKSTVLRISHLI